LSEPESGEVFESNPHRIQCHLSQVLTARGMTLTELSERTGITMANLSILKTNKARAVRFTTLTAICIALRTTPAELFTLDVTDAGPGVRGPA
jgi:putative transcriptional regulator